MLTDLREATEEAETDALAAEQDRIEADAAIKAAEAEAAGLRHALDQARAEAIAGAQAADEEIARLRLAVEQVEAAARAPAEPVDRPTMVASRIDEVQLRRLQEAEQARKALGRMARLRAAWRGE
jgi:small-conductance mechanosensitive channel